MEDFEVTLRNELTREYGAVLGSQELIHVLGFRTHAAMARSVREGRFTFPIFGMAGRAGKFATTADVARWISAQRNASINHKSESALPSATTGGEEMHQEHAQP